MPTEVALLEWGEDRGGVRLLGRSADPDVVNLVRRHLMGRLTEKAPTSESVTKLRLLKPLDGNEANES